MSLKRDLAEEGERVLVLSFQKENVTEGCLLGYEGIGKPMVNCAVGRLCERICESVCQDNLKEHSLSLGL